MITTDSKSLAYIKKDEFKGSYKGMRYRLKNQDDKLIAYVWPGPYAFDATDPEKIVHNEFEFTDEGRDQAIDWLNLCYEERKNEWRKINQSSLASLL